MAMNPSPTEQFWRSACQLRAATLVSMTNHATNRTVGAQNEAVETTTTLTRALITCGVVAGPLWVLTVLIQMLIRPGFDLRRHAISVLSNGDLGWIQITNFVVAGLLMVACAIGIRRALRAGTSGTWGPILLGAFGIGLLGAGFFSADPMNGFPPGTPSTTSQISWHGGLHFLFASIAFLSLIIVSTTVFARRYAELRETGWLIYSVATGIYFLVAWIALIVTGARNGAVSVAFALAVVLTWLGVSFLSVRLIRQARNH